MRRKSAIIGSFRLARQFCGLLAALVLGLLPQQARATIAFDGKDQTVGQPVELAFPVDDIERIAMELAVAGGAMQTPALVFIVSDASAMGLRFDVKTSRLVVSKGLGDEAEVGPVIPLGRAFKLALARASKGWALTVDGGAAIALDDDLFESDGASSFELLIGDPALVGKITSFRIERTGGAKVDLGGSGKLITEFSPRLGVYHRADAELNVPQPAYPKAAAQNGVFKREPYFSLSRHDGKLGLVFDWGGFLELAPDPSMPRRFIPADPAFGFAGAIQFAANSEEVFTAERSSGYQPRVPLLQDKATYHWIQQLGGIGNQNPSGQKFGEVWTADAKPSGFDHSVQGCFDAVEMDLVDFQSSGCRSAVFQLPPLDTANFRSSTQNSIVPFGWRYLSRAKSQGSTFSSIATTETEIESSYNGSSGSSFSAGASLSQNQSLSDSREDMTRDERMLSVHQQISTSHAIVLDPIYVRLNNCLITRILRMDRTATPPDYFVADPDPSKRAAPEETNYCPERFSGPNAVKLTPKEFVDLYGTHYAYAITYGKWGRETATYTSAAVEQLVSSGIEIENKAGFEVKPKGVKVGVELTDEQARQKAATLKAEGKLEESGWICIGGSSCNDGKTDGGGNEVPVYLHLMPFDQLLGPPYFTDTKVSVDLRAKVRAEIESRLATRQVDDAPPFAMYRLAVDKINCTGSRDFTVTLCSGAIAKNPLATVDLVVRGVLADGREVELNPPQSVPLANLLTTGVSQQFMVERQSPLGTIQSLSLSIAPHSIAAKGGALAEHPCCGDVWSLRGKMVVSAEDPGSWLEDASFVLNAQNDPSQGRISNITLPYGSDPGKVTFNQPVLTITQPGAFRISGPAAGQLSLAGTIDVVDIARELGFGTGPNWVTAWFEPLEAQADLVFKPGVPAFAYLDCPQGAQRTTIGCRFDQPQQTCPAGFFAADTHCVARGTQREIQFRNEAPIVAGLKLSFDQGGRQQRQETGPIILNQERVLKVPVEAENTFIEGQVYPSLGQRPAFWQPLDRMEAFTCFRVQGSIFKTYWGRC